MRTRRSMLVAVLVVIAGACGSGSEVTGRAGDAEAVVDVWSAVADGGGFRFAWTSSTEAWDAGEGATVVEIQGERDLERGLSHDIVTTTVTGTPVRGAVDDVPTEGTLVEEFRTLAGRSWRLVRERGGPWEGLADEGYDDGSPYRDAGFDPYGWGPMSTLLTAASVERFALVPGGGAGVQRLVGTAEEYGEGVEVVIELDASGALRHVGVDDGAEELDIWEVGRVVALEEPTPTAPGTADYYGTAEEPQVTGEWELEAEGEVGGAPWRILGAPGHQLGHDVPCRVLLAEPPDGARGWDDVDVALEYDIPACGAGGWGLSAAVADPSLQVLVPSWAWDSARSDPVPVAIVVSPRWVVPQVELELTDGTTSTVALDGGVGIVAMGGSGPAVAAVLLDDEVTCATGLTEGDVDDARYEGFAVPALLSGSPVICTR